MTTVFVPTPTERLALMSLHIEPNQTIERLQETTGARSQKHLGRALRTLCLARAVEIEEGEDGIERFRLRKTSAK